MNLKFMFFLLLLLVVSSISVAAQENGHCVIESLDTGGIVERGCFPTFAAAIAHITRGTVQLPENASPKAVAAAINHYNQATAQEARSGRLGSVDI